MGILTVFKEFYKAVIKLPAVDRFTGLIDNILHEKRIKIGVIHLVPQCFLNIEPVILIQMILVIRIHQ